MRPILLLPVLLSGAACTLPPEAGTAAQDRRECFWASGVTGFNDAGPDRALVNIGGRETWELTLSPGCPDIDWAMTIGIRSRGTQRICSGTDAELLIPSASGRSAQRCLVRTVRKLSPEEAAVARGDAPRP